MNNNNQKIQYKIVAGISLATGGAIGGVVLMSLETSNSTVNTYFPLIIFSLVLLGIGIFTMRKI